MRDRSRAGKILFNAKIGALFYLLVLFVSFFTRRIFLESLGDDFVGLTTTLKNLLGFLNLAELGVSGAVGYILYEPIFKKRYESLNEIISLFGYIYRWIGIVIIVLGVTLSAALPLIFRGVSVDMSVVYCTYYSFLVSSVLGYFVNYKQTLLSADQRSYVTTISLQSCVVVKSLVQAFLAYHTRDYYLFAAIEVLFGVLFTIILNWQIRRVYPWLVSSVRQGRSLLSKYPDLFRYTKQLFVHKLAGFAQTQLTPILLYAFVSLKVVAMYGNYMLIIGGVSAFIIQVLGTSEASVGDLIAEGDRRKIMSVYWELFSVRMFLSGVVIFCVYHLLNPFVELWLGAEYLLDGVSLALICATLYISLSRGATDAFKYGFALFSDLWAPIAEFVIFTAAALLGGAWWGFNGVLLGGVVSLFVVVWGWQPIFLFRSGLRASVMGYFMRFAKHIALFALCAYCAVNLIERYVASTPVSYLSWATYGVQVALIFSVIYLLAMWLVDEGMRGSIRRLRRAVR